MDLPPGYSIIYEEESRPANPSNQEDKKTVRVGRVVLLAPELVVGKFSHTIPEHQAYKIERDAWKHYALRVRKRITDALFGTEPDEGKKTPTVSSVVGAHADDLAYLQRRLEHQVARLNALVSVDGRGVGGERLPTPR